MEHKSGEVHILDPDAVKRPVIMTQKCVVPSI